MRFAVVVLAGVLAVAHAQSVAQSAVNTGKYVPDTGRYNPYSNRYNNQYNRYNNQYNKYNRYNNQYNPFGNQYNQYGQYNREYNPFKPFVSTTPIPIRSVTVTPAPASASAAVSSVAPAVTSAPVTVAPVKPLVPVAPVAPIAPFVPIVAAARVVADSAAAETVKFGNNINPDGAYDFFYETNNGITFQQQGVPRSFGGNPPVVPDVAQGAFSWYSPEGQLISINWVADENGYQPQGDAIPVPPPVPDQIARALAYVARTAPVPAVAAASAVASTK